MRNLWMLSLVLVGLGIPGHPLHAAQRRVLAELITNTSCGGCANANRVLTQLYEAHYNELSVIRYHAWWTSASDPFYQANIEENTRRINYYGPDYTPHLYLDGSVDGGYQTSTWENLIQQELAIPSPLIMTLDITYHPPSRTGRVITTVTVDSAVNFVAPKLRIALVESDILYNAPNGETEHHQIMRDMIPDAEGRLLTLGPGATVVDTQEFVVDSAWVAENCAIVAFVQDDGAGKRVYQSAMAYVHPEPQLRFHHYRVVDGNDQVLQPGETGYIYGSFINTGRVDAEDVVATLTSTDPYVTILQPQITIARIPLYQVTTAPHPFEIQLDPAFPDSYVTYLHLTLQTPDSVTFTDSFPVAHLPRVGFSDDFEGEDHWFNYGQYGQWHITEHRYHSEGHSKYCGLENLWHYLDNASVVMESPWIVVGAHDTLTFWHWYDTETAYDFAYVYLQTSTPYHRVPVDTFNGHLQQWVQEAYPLDDYAGSAIKLVFHFKSDGSVNYEGWYVDDVQVQPVGVREGSRPPVVQDEALQVALPQPVLHTRRLRMSLTCPHPGKYRIAIYSPSGRQLVHTSPSLEAGTHTLTLDLPGSLASGVYFLQVQGPQGAPHTRRFLYLKP